MSAVKIEPYRIDRTGTGRAKVNALYFKIPMTNMASLSAAIDDFLTANNDDLCQLGKMSGVEYFELDVGVVIDDGMMSRSTTLEPQAIATMASLNMTCIISAYRGGEPD